MPCPYTREIKSIFANSANPMVEWSKKSDKGQVWVVADIRQLTAQVGQGQLVVPGSQQMISRRGKQSTVVDCTPPVGSTNLRYALDIRQDSKIPRSADSGQEVNPSSGILDLPRGLGVRVQSAINPHGFLIVI